MNNNSRKIFLLQLIGRILGIVPLLIVAYILSPASPFPFLLKKYLYAFSFLMGAILMFIMGRTSKEKSTEKAFSLIENYKIYYFFCGLCALISIGSLFYSE